MLLLHSLFSISISLGATIRTRRHVNAIAKPPSTCATEIASGICHISDVYVHENVTLDATTTALVMIDVWNTTDPVLLDSYATRMLPLLAAAREIGLFIVHAPSGGPLLPATSPRQGELVIIGEDGRPNSTSRCDGPLRRAVRAGGAKISTVLLAGYDTNLCMIDKPCGARSLSTELRGDNIEVLLVRDASRPGPTAFENTFATWTSFIELIEQAPWLHTLPVEKRFIRSALTADIIRGFGLDAPLPPPSEGLPQVSVSLPTYAALPPLGTALTALVVVGATKNIANGNGGFQARIDANVARSLCPLIDAARAANVRVVHVSSSEATPPLWHACAAPLRNELVVATREQFERVVNLYSLTSLVYCGYPLLDVMWGSVAGFARYYPEERYLKQTIFAPRSLHAGANPTFYVVEGATLARESMVTIEGGWATAQLVRYRSYAHVISQRALIAGLCAAQRALPPPRRTNHTGNHTAPGSLIYALRRTLNISAATDAVQDTGPAHSMPGAGGGGAAAACDLSGGGGSSSGTPIPAQTVTIDVVVQPRFFGAQMNDRKVLCFRKTVGTPYAVYQIKGGAATGSLEYQVVGSSNFWSTITVPSFWTRAQEVTRITVIHDGPAVSIFRNGTLVAHNANFSVLDYTHVDAMVVGTRNADDFWLGTISNVSITVGAFPPKQLLVGRRGAPITALPAVEVAALADLYSELNGRYWLYRRGTDVYNNGSGAPWSFADGATPLSDPCGWFGVLCTDGASGIRHVLALFPNTRDSGNPLIGVLPASISALTSLEHLYTSNDVSQSWLSGTLPPSVGKLTRLKCMYFSHNNISGVLPSSLSHLTQLQAFLFRSNRLSGALPDFATMTQLRNVWFDAPNGLQNLTGTVTALGSLTNLTFLQASGNSLTGAVPRALCLLNCDGAGQRGKGFDCPLPVGGCCEITQCGPLPTPRPSPPPSTMGVCYPQ